MRSENNDEALNTILALALVLSGIAIFGWQIYEYLRYNIWTPLSLITALEWMKIQWATNPTDWLGLHTILKIAPLSVSAVVLGWLLAVCD